MDFSKRQDDPRRHLLGFSVVVVFHVLVVYALVNGLAKKVADGVRAPVETRLIEEIIQPPPPPPEPPPAPPQKVQAPPPKQVTPPPFVPPPEVVLTAPPPPEPTITAVTPTPPLAPVEIVPTPPPPLVVAEPAPPPKPAGPVAAGIACSRTPPPLAPSVASEVKGSLFVIGTLNNGRVVQVDIERNTLKGVTDRRMLRAFVSAVETAMKDGYVCAGDGVQIRQEFFFDIR